MNRSEEARIKLIQQLRGACSGELAAGFAYRGHRRSVSDPAHRDRLEQIEREEWHHRAVVQQLLRDLGSGPSPAREIVFWIIGKTIGLLCLLGGWFAPMYGAGKLEKSNIIEYEEAARYAVQCGRPEMIDCLLEMAEVEWEHERFFRDCLQEHRLLRFFPMWEAPPPKGRIRSAHAEWMTCLEAGTDGTHADATRDGALPHTVVHHDS